MTRLYLVDDHVVVREGLKALLQAAGHEVLGESDDPTQALADITRLSPQVLLLDLSLGGRSGFEVLAEIGKRRIDVRVVVLTMSSQPRNVAEAIRLGALGYVLKGASSEQLLLAIEAAAAGRRFLAAGEAELALRGLTEGQDDGLDRLSPRERQILVMVARGATSVVIGGQLHLSPKTVDTDRSRLMAKLGLTDVSGVVRWALRHHLIDPEAL